MTSLYPSSTTLFASSWDSPDGSQQTPVHRDLICCTNIWNYCRYSWHGWRVKEPWNRRVSPSTVNLTHLHINSRDKKVWFRGPLSQYCHCLLHQHTFPELMLYTSLQKEIGTYLESRYDQGKLRTAQVIVLLLLSGFWRMPSYSNTKQSFSLLW